MHKGGYGYLMPHVEIEDRVELLNIYVKGRRASVTGLRTCRVFLLLLNPDRLVDLFIRLPALILVTKLTEALLAVLSLQLIVLSNEEGFM